MVPAPNPLRELKQKPTLHYVLSCAFLFYVFMCASLLDTLVGYNARKFLGENELPKHVIAFMLLFFTIGTLNEMPSIFVTMLSTVLVYMWFLMMSKLPGTWNAFLLLLLASAFVLNEAVVRHFTPEWVYGVKANASQWSDATWQKHEGIHKEANQSRLRTRNHLILATYCIGGLVLGLTMAASLWFHSAARKARIESEKAAGTLEHHGRLWQLLYQPYAFQPKAWDFTSTRIRLEEKYELEAVIKQVLQRLAEQKGASTAGAAA